MMNHFRTWILLSAIGSNLPGNVLAQSCTEVPIPFAEFEIASNKVNPGDAVSPDGSQVFIQAVPVGAAPNAGAEIVTFNPRTRTTQQLTQGTLAATDFRGDINKFPTQFYARTSDERFLLTESNGTSSFPTLILPGQTQLTQVEVIEGIPGPATVIEAATGTKRILGSLANRPLAPGQFYIASLSNLTPTTVTVNESIVSVIVQRASNGFDYRVVTGRIGVASAAYNLATGTIVSPQPVSIYDRMVAKTGVPGFAPFAFQVSGDGNAISFYTSRNLEDPQRRFFSQLANNPSQITSIAYVYYLDTDEIKVIAPVNFSGPVRPTATTSSSVFVRNIGQTGKVFALDRGANYIGALVNPTYQAAPAFVQVGQNVKYIVEPGLTLPGRGVFANNLAFISRDEKTVYFAHTGDLVPGNNAQHSYELFSYEISTNKIRQISNFRDGIEQRLSAQEIANSPGQYQIQTLGSSSDGKVVAYSRSSFLSNRSLTRNAAGQYTVSQSSSGLPSAFSFRISVCN